MPIPLLAKLGSAVSKGAKAAKVAKTAKVASKASKIAKGANVASKTAKTANLAKVAPKKKLSLSMLADDGVNTYPGSKLDKFKTKSGDILRGAADGAGDVEFEKPSSAQINTDIPQAADANSTYSSQIQKLNSLQ